MNLSLSLFDDEPEPDRASSSTEGNGEFLNRNPANVNENGPIVHKTADLASEPFFDADRPEPHTPFDWAVLRPERQPATVADAHPLAFVAVCRAAGIEHPALTPIATDPSGARRFEAKPLQRLANLILRGVESDRPEVTPERWREAGGRAAAWWTERKVAA